MKRLSKHLYDFTDPALVKEACDQAGRVRELRGAGDKLRANVAKAKAELALAQTSEPELERTAAEAFKSAQRRDDVATSTKDFLRGVVEKTAVRAAGIDFLKNALAGLERELDVNFQVRLAAERELRAKANAVAHDALKRAAGEFAGRAEQLRDAALAMCSAEFFLRQKVLDHGFYERVNVPGSKGVAGLANGHHLSPTQGGFFAITDGMVIEASAPLAAQHFKAALEGALGISLPEDA